MDGNFGGPRGPRGFAPVNVGDEIDVKIEAVGEKGDGIAKAKGFVLFVPGTNEGDEVKIRITKVLRKVGFAEVIGSPGGGAPSESAEESPVEEPAEAPAPEPAAEDTEDFGEEEAPKEKAPEEEVDAESFAEEDLAKEEPAAEEPEPAEEAPAEEPATEEPAKKEKKETS